MKTSQKLSYTNLAKIILLNLNSSVKTLTLSTKSQSDSEPQDYLEMQKAVENAVNSMEALNLLFQVPENCGLEPPKTDEIADKLSETYKMTFWEKKGGNEKIQFRRLCDLTERVILDEGFRKIV